MYVGEEKSRRWILRRWKSLINEVASTLVWEVNPPGQCIFGKEVFWTTWIKRCLRFVVPNVWLSQGFSKNRPHSQSILNTRYRKYIIVNMLYKWYIWDLLVNRKYNIHDVRTMLCFDLICYQMEYKIILLGGEMVSHVSALPEVKGFPYRLSDFVQHPLIRSQL